MKNNDIIHTTLSKSEVIDKLLHINRHEEDFKLKIQGEEVYILQSARKNFVGMKLPIYNIHLQLEEGQNGTTIKPRFKGNTTNSFFMVLSLFFCFGFYVLMYFKTVPLGIFKLFGLQGLLPAIVFGTVNQVYILKARKDFEELLDEHFRAELGLV